MAEPAVILLLACAPDSSALRFRPISRAADLGDGETKLTASDAAAGDYFGVEVAPAGDVDGDGFADLLVGALADDDVGSASGSAYVYFGGTNGVLAATETKLTASDGSANNYFGCNVDAAGDIDADGLADVLIGAYCDSDVGTCSGSAYVYRSGLASERILHASDAATADYYGISVSGLGDVDGDGFDDIAVGADGDDDRASDAGAVYIYRGSGSGIDPSTEDKLTASDATTQALLAATYGLSGPGDIDDDGYADLAASAYLDDAMGTNSGALYVWYGSASGIDSASVDKITASDGTASHFFGWSVGPAGDVDADGFMDVVVGAIGDSSYAGAVYLYRGSSGGLTGEQKLTASDAASSDRLGVFVHGGGDVDDDGYDDLVAGAYMDDDAGAASGSAYLWYGNDFAEEKLTASDAATDDYYGQNVVVLGDVDGDATADLAVGAYRNDDAGTESGAVYVYRTPCTDADGDGACAEDDCDDDDATAFPGATEVCDAADVDEDCDGSADDASAIGTSTFYADGDGDGFGGASSMTACDAPSGYVGTPGDCDDADAAVNPGATEVCDEADLDEDCDGVADDATASGGHTLYADLDGDGYGGSSTTTACDASAGWVAASGDCDDTDADVSPGAPEVCDAADTDEDCDGSAEESGASGETAAYIDDDGDGFGDPATESWACDHEVGIAEGTDCDDADANTFPGAAELELLGACTNDDDDDGYGDHFVSARYAEGTDCDDTDPADFPGAPEVVNDGDDDDCDDVDACYSDHDRDGFGTTTQMDADDLDCTDPGESGNARDCDDDDASVHPDADEIAGDGIDQDCDGADAIGDTGVEEEADNETAPEKEQAAAGEGCGCGGGGAAPGVVSLLLLAYSTRRFNPLTSMTPTALLMP